MPAPQLVPRLDVRRRWGPPLFALAASLAAACSDGNPLVVGEASGGGGGRATGGAALIGDGGVGIEIGLGGSETSGPGSGGAGLTELVLRVTAEREELVVEGQPDSVQLSASYDDDSLPNQVVWSVDDTRVGSVNDAGEFRANGFVGGEVTITATVGSQSASITLSVSVAIVRDPDGLPRSVQDELVMGGSGGPDGLGPDAGLRFLYPYDETVFPRGLAAPVIQLAGVAATASYIKLTTSSFSYEAFAESSGPTRVTLPEEVWRGASLSAGPSEWVEVAVSKRSGASVTGPIEQRWLVAQGSLKGLVYYNTYRSPLAGNNGAIMRIKPGGSAEVLQSGCTVCHSVSANGNVMVAGVQWDGDNAAVSRSYDLPANGGIALRNEQADGRVYAFGGLTPDGALMLTSGVPAAGAKMRGMKGELLTRLLATATGQTVPAPSFPIKLAMTPNFSPDGSRVAFSNHDASAAGHVLSVMSFDAAETPPVFAELSNVVSDPQKVVAWPSFLPDSKGVLFHAGDSFDTAGFQGGAQFADLRLVDLETKQVSALDALNGYDENGVLYLPGGAAQEAHLNYEPSVLPVAVGGYYWVFFTSRRTYGNTIAPGGSVPRGDDIWGIPQGSETETPSPRKKIWVAAIDLDHQGGVDPSHPAFYLPGQELSAGNMRAFAALEPCKKQGKACESAAECCAGFCRETARDASGNPLLKCVPPPDNTCSNLDESCGTAGDCCSSKQRCINQRCAAPPPPPPR